MAGLLGSLFNGNTGLKAASIGVSVTGDNIANTNTVGFKSGRAHFADLVSEMIVGTTGQNQVGRGVTLERIEKLFTQGSFQQTGVPTDMAISGDGFFVLRQPGEGTNSYSRAGQFRFDDDGFLISQSGLRVQGYSADTAGLITGGLDDIQLTTERLEPQATDEVSLRANLDPDTPIVPADGSALAMGSVTVYDSLGNAHEVALTASHTAADTWEVTGLVDGAAPAVPVGQLTFDADGRIQAVANNQVNFAWPNAAAANVTFDFGDATEGVSAWGSATTNETFLADQNGYASATLENVHVEEDGSITGSFSNGRTVTLAQVALATFSDPTELNAVGGNQFMQTGGSGEPVIGAAQTNGRGTVLGGALELSNVEISDSFIDLIAYQRAFQANSRTIQTADGLIQEVFQLLR